MSRYYDAEKAAEKLGVSRNTLYSYVSRGLIRSELDSKKKRTRRYSAKDVDRLVCESEVFKSPQDALMKTTNWGAPILESAITKITTDNFYYRGRSALDLAENSHFEETVALLWQPAGMGLTPPDSFAQQLLDERLQSVLPTEPLDEVFLSLLTFLNREFGHNFTFSARETAQAGNLMIAGFLRLVTGCWSEGHVSEQLGCRWQLDPVGCRLVDAALTLVADHELNISSFTARCSASAGCSPYSAVATAAQVFSGRRHGGNLVRISTLLDQADSEGSLFQVIAWRIDRGESVPGFGHRLYDIDPRANYLLAKLPSQQNYVKEAQRAAAELLGGRYPTVDFALLLLERELALPAGSAMLIFQLGRLSGWMAHIMEQYDQGQTIRPRSKYIGPVVQS